MPEPITRDNGDLAVVPDEIIRRAYASDQLRSIDREKRTIDFIISSESVDRFGDIIRVKGWDLKAFRKNPVFLFGHDSRQPPIGQATKVTKAAPLLLGTAQFMDADISPFADSVFKMFVQRFLRSVSVGFMPKDFKRIEDDDGNFMGIEFIKQELLEFSAVPVPANPDALVAARSFGIDVQPFKSWAEDTLDDWNGEHGILARTAYGLDRDRVEQIRREAAGSGISILVPADVQDGILARNLDAVKSQDEEGSDEMDVKQINELVKELGQVDQEVLDEVGNLVFEVKGEGDDKEITVSGGVIPVIASFATDVLVSSGMSFNQAEDGTWSIKADFCDPGFTYEILGHGGLVKGEPNSVIGKLISSESADNGDNRSDTRDLADIHAESALLPAEDVSDEEMELIKTALEGEFVAHGEVAPWLRSPSEWNRYVETVSADRISAARGMCESLFEGEIDGETVWPLTDEEKTALQEDDNANDDADDDGEADGKSGEGRIDVTVNVTDAEAFAGKFGKKQGDGDKSSDPKKPKKPKTEDDDDGEQASADQDGTDMRTALFSDANLTTVVGCIDDTMEGLDKFLDDSTHLRQADTMARADARKLRYLADCFEEAAQRLRGLVGGKVKPSGDADLPDGEYASVDDIMKLITGSGFLDKIKGAVEAEFKRQRGQLD